MEGIAVIFLRYSNTYESNTTSAVLDSTAVKADITYAMSAFSAMSSPALYRAGDAEMQEGMSCSQDIPSYIQEWTFCMHGVLSLIKNHISRVPDSL